MGNLNTRNTTNEIADRVYLSKLTEQEKYEWPRAPKDPKFLRHEDYRPDPRLMNSWFKNPFTEIFDNSMNMQHNPVCGKIELGMMNCLEAYGLPNGFYKCRDLMDDYGECISEEKRYRRCKVMRRERQRQYNDGERAIKYSMPPKPGSFEL